MATAYLRKGVSTEDPSFNTPDISKPLEIHPEQSYEVTIEGDNVIVAGSSLKPMRSKRGYYRLLYQGKLFVLHFSEIREVDRTENDVVMDTRKNHGVAMGNADTDEDAPQIPAAPRQPYPQFTQNYNVKLNNTWMTLPQAAVVPSRSRPGFYNVTYQGQIFNVSAVNVVPINYNATQQPAPLQQPQRPVFQPAPAAPAVQPQQPPRYVNQPSRYEQYAALHYNNNQTHQTPYSTVPASIPSPPNVPLQHFQSPQLPGNQFHNPQQVVEQPLGQVTQQLNNMSFAQPPNHRPQQTEAPVRTQPQKAPKPHSSTGPAPPKPRTLRRESYTVEKPVAAGKVNILVGGTWKTVDRKMVKPSKKKPGTFIARVEGKSVRLTETQIAESVPEKVTAAPGTEKDVAVFNVFIDGVYVTVGGSQIEESQTKPGYKIVTSDGITQLIHSNFVFPMREANGSLQPVIPDFYKVFLTPEGVTVPKENIKPDNTSYNTFMVLWNNVIYKLNAESLVAMPITGDGKVQTQMTEKPRRNTLMDPTIAASQRKKSPVKKADKAKPKPKISTTTKRTIPTRPKGKFPSNDGEENITISKTAEKKDKQFQRVTESLTTLESTRTLCTRSPFQSPVSWDKRLRRTPLIQNGGPKPAWRVSTVIRGNHSGKSKKLLYKKMMVPSKTAKGRYHIYGSPASEDTGDQVTLTEFINRPSIGGDDGTISRSNTEGRCSVPPSVSTAASSALGSVLSEQTVVPVSECISEQPYISDHCVPMLATTPGVPVLQDPRVLVGQDARANRDWVRTLRAL